jgi:hypothetical protein
MATEKFANHADLVANWDTYQKISDFEDGSVDRVNQYLIPYGFERESNPKAHAHFYSRIERLHNDNFIDRYLKLHTGHMSQPVRLSGIDGNKRLEQVRDDVTGFGCNYTQAVRERLYNYLRDGRVGTLVDGPSKVSKNKKDANASGERSYQIIYTATQIRFWEFFTVGPRKGQLKTLVVEATPYVDEQGGVHEQFRMFKQPEGRDAPFEWLDLRAQKASTGLVKPDSERREYDVIGEPGTGGVAQIPFVLRGRGPIDSFVRSTADGNATHMNLVSVYDNVLYYTGFQKLAFVGVTPEELDKWAEAAALLIANQDAKLFTVDPANPQGLEKAIARKERHLERQGKFEYNQLADDTRQVQSADSKDKDLIVRRVIYDKTIDFLESDETRIWRYVAEIEGEKTVDKIAASIGRDYGLEDKKSESAQLAVAWIHASELNVPSLKKEIMKIEATWIPYVPSDDESREEVRARIIKDIENAQGQPLGLPGLSGQQVKPGELGPGNLQPLGKNVINSIA